MTQYTDPAFVPRVTCYRCFRPQMLCYCDMLDPVDNRTRIIVVQHPREQFHPLNTARIAEYGLKSSVVLRHRPSEMSAALKRAEVADDAAILFPSDDAEDLETLTEDNRPRELIVVDGTWSHAKTLLRDVPALARYRRIKFTPDAPSTYRIRKEPKADYLSTIESIAYVLRILEPETPGLERLQHVFSSMIDRNIEARRPGETGPRHQQRRRKLPHRFPDELTNEGARFVAVYCEGTSRFAKRTGASEELFDDAAFRKEPLVAYFRRVATGETLRVLLRTERKPPARLLDHLKLSAEEIEHQASNHEEALKQVRAWLEPSDIPVVWNASSRDILIEMGLSIPVPVVLKGVFCDYMTFLERSGRSEFKASSGSWGGMEHFLDHLALDSPVPPHPGRGALRLAQTETLLSWIAPRARASCMATEN